MLFKMSHFFLYSYEALYILIVNAVVSFFLPRQLDQRVASLLLACLRTLILNLKGSLYNRINPPSSSLNGAFSRERELENSSPNYR